MKALLNPCMAATAVALAALVAGCSDDDSNNPDNPSAAITVTATAYTPAADNDGTIINGTEIVVSAFTLADTDRPVTVMDNVVVSKIENAWSYSPTAYWPSTAVDFYGFTPKEHVAPHITATAQSLTYDNDGTADFMYAASKGMRPASGNINLNFRHALAKVEFNFRTSSADTTVLVQGVKLRGVLRESTFTWPKGSTGIGSMVMQGKWEPDMSTPDEVRDNVYVICTAEPQPQPVSKKPVCLNTTMCYYFLPQTLNTFMSISSGDRGAYLEVTMQVTRTADGKVLWPDQADETAYATVLVPVRTTGATRWEASREYAYDIVLGTPRDGRTINAVKAAAMEY